MSTTDRAEMPTSSAKVPRHIAALVPLVVLSTVWTAHLTNPYALANGNRPEPEFPGALTVPTDVQQEPASYSQPTVLGSGAPQRRVRQAAAPASADGIPSAALAAYQRAESVINAADETCNADWQLLAAVGRVESDHGRYGGNTLGADGTSRPGIYGIPLDGTNKTQAIPDTDAGRYDRDDVWDRAVGPMQFIPTTWSSVGVDADGDGQRNPQNINDAALAAAVYLCSGSYDLGNEAGRRAAVLRYNQSQSYADLVLRIREAYLEGDYSAVPARVAPAGAAMPTSSRRGDATAVGGKKASQPGRSARGRHAATGHPGSASEPNSGDQGRHVEPEVRPASPPSEKAPTVPPQQSPKKPDGTLEKIAEPLPAPVGDPVDQALTLTEATTRCTTAGVSRLDLLAWNRCINDLVS